MSPTTCNAELGVFVPIPTLLLDCFIYKSFSLNEKSVPVKSRVAPLDFNL